LDAYKLILIFNFRTKELLIRVLPYLSGHTLPGSLRIDSTPDEESRFADREDKIRASGKTADFEEYVEFIEKI